MLTTLTLPKEYDSLPLLTQLWLQSRVFDPAKPGIFLPSRQVRPFNLRNLGIAIDMLYLMSGRMWASACSNEHRPFLRMAAAYIFCKLLDGVLPAFRYAVTGRLLALAERAVSTGKPVEWSEALTAGALATCFAVFDTMSKTWFQRIETAPIAYLLKQMDMAYIWVKLGETHEQEVDPVQRDLIDEASVKGSQEMMFQGSDVVFSYQGPYEMVPDFGNLLRCAIGIVAQSFVVWGALKSSESSALNMLFLAVFIMPMLISLVRNIFVRSDWGVDVWHDGAPLSQQRLNHFRRTFVNLINKKAEITVFGLRGWLLRKWEGYHDLRAAVESLMSHPEDTIVDASLIAIFKNLAWVLLATRVVATSTSLAALTLLQSSMLSFGSRLEEASESVHRSVNHTILVAALYAALDNNANLQDGDVDYESTRKLGGMGINVCDLSVSYQKGKPAVSGINLTIAPGETLAIVGYNGSGKTTLVKALLGLVPCTGNVIFNGVPFSRLQHGSFYNRVSCILQDFVKYPLTVRENIGIGNVGSMEDDEAIATAVMRGGAQDVVDRHTLEALLTDTERRAIYATMKDMETKLEEVMEDSPNKDAADTQVKDSSVESKSEGNDGGSTSQKATKAKSEEKPELWRSLKFLSGGEWQRLALARAFMGADRADLVVFDEPTSALDPRAEADLFERLYALAHRGDHRCTTIFISHGFGNVRRADKIAFMDKGAIIEYGTHEELMALDGKYSEMFNLQRKKFTA